MYYYFIGFIVSSIVLLIISKRWCLPIKRTIIVIVISILLSIVSVYLTDFWMIQNSFVQIILAFVLMVIFYVLIILFLFYRDPERYPPEENNIIVSPADGKVIYINRTIADDIISIKKKNRILINEIENIVNKNQRFVQIGIAMVYTDVHVNRTPISGKVKFIKHTKGKFYSLRNEDALAENERQTIIIENDLLDIIIIQIATRLVRRILSYINTGQEIKIGEKIGAIKLGSQVDLLIPEEKIKEINIKLNDYLVAGETIIARY